jgi:hypothetical protein
MDAKENFWNTIKVLETLNDTVWRRKIKNFKSLDKAFMKTDDNLLELPTCWKIDGQKTAQIYSIHIET